MPVAVDVLLPDESRATLRHGSIIGRLRAASICIPDPRISEAHAMVSLRGRAVRLLGLRGRFYVDGRTCSEVDLSAGMAVHLARDLALRILEVRVPERVPALRAEGMPEQTLLGLTSIHASPPRLTPKWVSDADEVVWPGDDGWFRRDGTPLRPGPLQLGATAFEVREVRTMGVSDTIAGTGFTSALTLECYFDVVHLKRGGRTLVTIRGTGARMVSELASIRQPVAWEALAQRLWGDLDPPLLRKRWDMQLYRLRKLLRTNKIRTDLVCSHGTGLVELVLTDHDQVIDHA
jgi:hypothetical protein